jgi:hypothetical protein
MVAIALQPGFQSADAIDPFLAMLPVIRRAADRAFWHLRAEAREEMAAEVVAIAFWSYRRLVESGKAALAYPSVLAKFAIRHARQGRLLASRLNTFDVTSPYAQRRKAIRIRSLDCSRSNGDWEQLVACRQCKSAWQLAHSKHVANGASSALSAAK